MVGEIQSIYQTTTHLLIGGSIVLGGRIIYDWLKTRRNGNGKTSLCDPDCKVKVDAVYNAVGGMSTQSAVQTEVLKGIHTEMKEHNNLLLKHIIKTEGRIQ